MSGLRKGSPMRKKIRIAGVFAVGLLVGLLIGWVTMFVFMGINTKKVMAIYADSALLEMAVNARQIRAGQADALLDRLDRATPLMVVQFDKVDRKFSKSSGALWQVQRYYSENPSLSVPDQVKRILDSLPPDPYRSIGKEESTLTKIEDKVPSFELRTLDGQNVKVTDLRGKVVLLNFFATWCGPCLEEMPHLEKKIWQRFKNEKFTVIAIGREHSNSELIVFKKKNKLTFPIGGDPKRKIYELFAKNYIPRNYVIDTEGKIIFQSIGYTKGEFDNMIKTIEKAVEESKAVSKK